MSDNEFDETAPLDDTDISPETESLLDDIDISAEIQSQLDDIDLSQEFEFQLDDNDLSPGSQATDGFTDFLENIEDHTFKDNLDQLISSVFSNSPEERESNEFMSDEFANTYSDDQNDPEDSDSEKDEETSTTDNTNHRKQRDISFGAAGKCWHCGGTGVVWEWGETVKCDYCGGSGIR